MPTPTPIMQSEVPCDGAWHTIYTAPRGAFAHVFVKFTGATCTFTARLSDNAPPPPPPPDPPGPAPANAVPKAQLVIPTGGGFRALNAAFDYFEVKCEPPEGGGSPEQQQMPEVEASRKRSRAEGALHECPFEWYMMI